jgi:PhnB protein
MTAGVPPGFHSITPYLVVRGAARAIEFYKQAFGAVERFAMPAPDGKLMHAEITIGDSIVMLADEFPEYGAVGPETLGGVTSSLLLYVEHVDASFQRALDAGCKVLKPLENQFWGDRMGTVTDPFGHKWSLSSVVEHLTPEEMQQRMNAAMQQFGQPS